MNVKYYKDLNHNFLIISDKICGKEQDYQYKMISGNKIGHLLDCKIRFINDECSFHYEISSRQSLENLFSSKEMGYEEIFNLLENIKEALDELDKFLLDSRYLLLLPEYIFAEPESKEYFFLYYPCAEETNTEIALTALAEFLVSKVNHEQEDAINLVYNIYEAVRDGNFMLLSILDLFQSPIQKNDEADIAEEIDAEDIEEKDCDSSCNNNLNYGGNRDCYSDCRMEENNLYLRQEESDIGGSERRSHLAAVGVLAFLCAVAAAGIFGIGYFFILSAEERLVSAIGIAILVILSAVLFLYFILNIFKEKNSAVKEEEKQEAKRPKVKYENVQTEQRGEIKGYGRKSTGVYSRDQKKADEQGEYGNTVFLDTSAYKKEHKLYGTNKGNKYHIDLTHLPCTIGKMAGNVDIVIKDGTISRIHARFTKKENEIYVTDMNSTNGTFKNGLRLNPNETVVIEQGDELRFGRMTFSYR